MCQVYIPCTNLRIAAELLWSATSCRLFREQIKADFSQIPGAKSVDLEIGTRSPDEVRARLAELGYKTLEVHVIQKPREFPNPEHVRMSALYTLRSGANG